MLYPKINCFWPDLLLLATNQSFVHLLPTLSPVQRITENASWENSFYTLASSLMVFKLYIRSVPLLAYHGSVKWGTKLSNTKPRLQSDHLDLKPLWQPTKSPATGTTAETATPAAQNRTWEVSVSSASHASGALGQALQSSHSSARQWDLGMSVELAVLTVSYAVKSLSREIHILPVKCNICLSGFLNSINTEPIWLPPIT